MKIGVLTYHRAYNYGSYLQTYALQTYIKNNFTQDVEVINFVPDNQDMYDLFVTVSNLRNLIGNIIKFRIKKPYEAKIKGFDTFLKNNIRLSKFEYTKNDAITEEYDIVISGSDQIWNPDSVDFSWVYFQENIKTNKKISYAPSIGGGKFKNIERLKKNLIQFSNISVREQKGKDYLNKITNNVFDISVVVDPTLLLTQEEYEKITSKRRYNKDYIFLYSVYNNNEILVASNYLGKKYNLPVITVISLGDTYKVLFKGIKIGEYESVEDFLSYIKYAKYVFTNSFHGTVLSIIFRQNFYYFGDYEKDPRINNILSILGLESRAIPYSDVETLELEDAVYSDFEENFERIISDSKEFLQKSILGE